jgi:hypothetical protein
MYNLLAFSKQGDFETSATADFSLAFTFANCSSEIPNLEKEGQEFERK